MKDIYEIVDKTIKSALAYKFVLQDWYFILSYFIFFIYFVSLQFGDGIVVGFPPVIFYHFVVTGLLNISNDFAFFTYVINFMMVFFDLFILLLIKNSLNFFRKNLTLFVTIILLYWYLVALLYAFFITDRESKLISMPNKQNFFSVQGLYDNLEFSYNIFLLNLLLFQIPFSFSLILSRFIINALKEVFSKKLEL